jgi:hypothetical protein
MNRPGFNAETSLYKTNENYRMVASAEQAAVQVLPQGIIANAICGVVGNLCQAGFNGACDEVCDVAGGEACGACVGTGENDCANLQSGCNNALGGLGL